jgi:predicted nuclease of predicted toxin-antitoxin system
LSLKLLANENFPLPSVHQLRRSGFDILSISETSPGLKDEAVLDLAAKQARGLMTFDRDYGELVYRRRMPCPPAIIYLRFDPASPTEPAQVVQSLLSIPESELSGYFLVLDRDSVRKRLLPRAR